MVHGCACCKFTAAGLETTPLPVLLLQHHPSAPTSALYPPMALPAQMPFRLWWWPALVLHACYGYASWVQLSVPHMCDRCVAAWLAGALTTVLLDVRARRLFLITSASASSCGKPIACCAVPTGKSGSIRDRLMHDSAAASEKAGFSSGPA